MGDAEWLCDAEAAGPSLSETTTYAKSPGPCRGFLDRERCVGSVPGSDGGAAPVEAIDQRGVDGLHHRLEGDRVGGERAEGRRKSLIQGGAVVISRAIFSLHEPARR